MENTMPLKSEIVFYLALKSLVRFNLPNLIAPTQIQQ